MEGNRRGGSRSGVGRDSRDGHENEWKSATDRDGVPSYPRTRQRPGIREAPKNQWR